MLEYCIKCEPHHGQWLCVPLEDESTNKNDTDSEECIKCTEDEWPNGWQDQCIPKVMEFLSYDNDVISSVFSFFSLLLFLIAIVVLVIYHSFKDSAIVKANNRNLSFILLVSIMLSYLCVFLFLGRPVDITCMLRQCTFAIIFSISISCVMGKTVMIYIVFKASKPGSAWRKWVSVKVSNSVVLIFSSIQIIINITWLIILPPFQELDKHSYSEKIIVQCNEGSVIAFYSVLGYMGFLAAVSFILAFFARNLPDSFNEAKYITFSMLVFCSVWIAMIPAYLSTKGKNIIAVEIFAILTSSSGLLGCIFFPKCYLILFRPEINTKAYLLACRTNCRRGSMNFGLEIPFQSDHQVMYSPEYIRHREGALRPRSLARRYGLLIDQTTVFLILFITSFGMIYSGSAEWAISKLSLVCAPPAIPSPHDYINMLIFIFAIEQVNMSPDILPNITLGYHLYDSCADARKALKSVVQILSGPRKNIPNYSCNEEPFASEPFVMRLSVSAWLLSHQLLIIIMYNFMHLSYVFKISYGATDYLLTNEGLYPHFFRTVQNNRIHDKIIVYLLKYFGWNWVGIFMEDKDTGWTESQTIIKYMKSHDVCVAFNIKIKPNNINFSKILAEIHKSSAKIIISKRRIILSLSEHEKKALNNEETTWDGGCFPGEKAGFLFVYCVLWFFLMLPLRQDIWRRAMGDGTEPNPALMARVCGFDLNCVVFDLVDCVCDCGISAYSGWCRWYNLHLGFRIYHYIKKVNDLFNSGSLNTFCSIVGLRTFGDIFPNFQTIIGKHRCSGVKMAANTWRHTGLVVTLDFAYERVKNLFGNRCILYFNCQKPISWVILQKVLMVRKMGEFLYFITLCASGPPIFSYPNISMFRALFAWIQKNTETWKSGLLL
ncbi:vomeronasal type-2 receptor 26-like [Pelobates cultripes]|uniref:Vomeronasal type-2 receptor 26-like n=1 Tax=Pelobates cultripes TaxID=61616 RepID=A0AAD1SDI4_PELCU|nr:vomeronasal type-2 receptor 26-like [Pelobates cultripes]